MNRISQYTTLNDVTISGCHVTLWIEANLGLKVSYPTEQCAKTAYRFVMHAVRAFAADGEQQRKIGRSAAYFYGMEITVSEFVSKFQHHVDKIGYFAEWVRRYEQTAAV